MGIRGLHSKIHAASQRVVARTRLKSLGRVGVDGEGLLHALFTLSRERSHHGCGCPCATGCVTGLIAYSQTVTDYLAALLAALPDHGELVVFVDGERGAAKDRTRISRRASAVRAAMNALGRSTSRCSSGVVLPPALLRHAFLTAVLDVADAGRITLVRLASDSDAGMVAYGAAAETRLDALIAQDSDFLVYPALAGYMPISSLSALDDPDAASGLLLPPFVVAAALGLPSPLLLPVFGALAGNDYVDLSKWHARLISRRSSRDKGLSAVASYIASSRKLVAFAQACEAGSSTGSTAKPRNWAAALKPLFRDVVRGRNSAARDLWAVIVSQVEGYLTGSGLAPESDNVGVVGPEALPRDLRDLQHAHVLWIPPCYVCPSVDKLGKSLAPLVARVARATGLNTPRVTIYASSSFNYERTTITLPTPDDDGEPAVLSQIETVDYRALVKDAAAFMVEAGLATADEAAVLTAASRRVLCGKADGTILPHSMSNECDGFDAFVLSTYGVVLWLVILEAEARVAEGTFPLRHPLLVDGLAVHRVADSVQA